MSLLAAPCVGLIFVFWFSSLMVTSLAELERFEHPPKNDGSLSLLVIGDWGRNGRYNQSKVALQVIIIYLFLTCLPKLVLAILIHHILIYII